jgi:predicted permease
MHSILQDIRYATRQLLKAPGFTASAVLTIALAIGATTAVFSIVYGVLIKPLPYREPSQLVRVASVNRGRDVPMSVLDYLDYKAQNHSFADIAAMDPGTANMTGNGSQPVRLRSTRVGASFFHVLGIEPALGRCFATGDDAQGAPHVVVLSYGTWKAHFGGDPRIVGQSVLLDGEAYTVIGVAPSWMNYPQKSEVWVPMQFQPFETDPNNRGSHSIYAVARLAAGATPDGANRDLAAIGAQLAQRFPDSNAEFTGGAFPMQAQMVQNARGALLTLLGAVGFVLLVACANVANLLLVRASARETEMAVRTALGAGRWRIVRQLVTESILLAGTGAVFGVLLANWVVDAVVAFGPRGLPRLDEVGIDARIVVFAALLALVTGALFGIVPALHAARPDISGMLRAGARGSSGRAGAQRMRHGLVIAESALAVILLVGAGLFLRSFVHLVAVDPGFNPAHVTAATVTLPNTPQFKRDHDVGAFAQRLLDRVSSLPGVQQAAIGFGRPFAEGHVRTTFEIEGQPRSQPGNRRLVMARPVSPAYFPVLGIPLVSGRMFTDQDRTDGRQVVLLSQEAARRYFKGVSPIGQQITLGWERDTAEWGAHHTVGGEIVGVVADVTEQGAAAENLPVVYTPFAQVPVGDITVLVRSGLGASAISGELRSAVHDLDSALPVYGVTTMDNALGESVAQPRFYTLLLSGFAFIGLLLAAVGIYGVISYGVTLRQREIGIRLALGSSRQRIVRLTLGQGVALAVVGIPIGLAGAYWLSRYIGSLLFGVHGADAVTYGVVPLVLLAVAALASYLPARRAARVDPVITMRAD